MNAHVTQQYVLVLSVSVKYVLSTYLCYLYYLYRLYYWSTYLRGLAVHLYRLFQDIYVIQCCTSTRHSTSHIHHSFI